MNIRNQKLLYHFTSIDNLASIDQNGLLARNEPYEFTDVAGHDILQKRGDLANYVPFHFFANNPFDRAVQDLHENDAFIYLTVQRSFAQDNNWPVKPEHPLGRSEPDEDDQQTVSGVLNRLGLNTNVNVNPRMFLVTA